MTLKELAHLAQQTLHTRAGCPVRRSHVHELLAAAFGHRSWAAFLSDSVLADSGVGAAPTGGLPDLIGRAVQLGYEQQAAATVAITLHAFIAEHRLSAVSLADLRAALLPAAQVADRDDLDDDDDGIEDDDEGCRWPRVLSAYCAPIWRRAPRQARPARRTPRCGGRRCAGRGTATAQPSNSWFACCVAQA